jgi:hypothetical protein
MPIAASNWQDLGVPVIILIMVAGSWVFNKLKEMQVPPSQHGDGDGDGDGDEAAQRRRFDEVGTRSGAHSQQTAQHRSAAQSTSDPTQTEPQNLTLAERIERARARAQYQKRAEMLRRQRAHSAQKPLGRPTDMAGPAPGPKPVASTPPSQQPTRTRAPSPPTRRRAPLPELKVPAPRRPSTKPARATKRIKSQLNVADAPSPDPARGGRESKAHTSRTIPALTKGLDRSSLRRVIVLKEILDRPVCLRDPFDTLS